MTRSKKSVKKPKGGWEEIWREALAKGTCPFEGCGLKQQTCEHLDHYLAMEDRTRFKKPSTVSTRDIEAFSGSELFPEQSAWELFKKLRPYRADYILSRCGHKVTIQGSGLLDVHIRILLKEFAVGMGRIEIMQDLGMRSVSQYQKLRQQAFNILKEVGFRG